jgi:hypothetical protein
MCKTVAIYQQTFLQEDTTKSSATFRFTRVLKERGSQYFLIKCLGIGSITGQVSHLFLRKFPVLTGKCNTHSNTQGDTNDVYLGTLGANVEIEPTFMINDLPLNDFEIYRERNGITITGAFAVSFQIEVKEAD